MYICGNATFGDFVELQNAEIQIVDLKM
jgi:hypothetical protein